MTSLPVPVSPVTKTVVFVPATASTWARIERRLPRRPTIVSRNENSVRSGLRAFRSAPRYRVFIGVLFGYGLGCMTEFEAVLMFCSRFIARTLQHGGGHRLNPSLHSHHLSRV